MLHWVRKRRGRLFLLAVLVVGGLAAGVAVPRVLHARAYAFPTRSSPVEVTEVARAKMTPEALDAYVHIKNRLRRKTRLTPADFRRIRDYMEWPAPEPTPALSNALPHENPEARRLFSAGMVRRAAEALLIERLRADENLPPGAEEFTRAHILAKLDADSPNARISGIANVVSSELLYEHEIRVKVEMMRADPDRGVREQAARQLEHWDRTH